MGKQTILITGGSGLIGKPLTKRFIELGYTVKHLSRKPSTKNPNVEVFVWDVYKGSIDERCITGVDIIIHLAGEGIADKRWTEERKRQIIKSRTASIGLIYNLLKKTPNQVKRIISASGIGYYSERGDELLYEDSKPGKGFLAESCIEWENAVDEGSKLGLQILKFRTGVVLSEKGGALPELDKMVKLGLGAALGSGKQWMSWIHLEDAVKMYVYAVENNSMKGTYNMATNSPVTNKQVTQAIAKTLHKPLWLPNVPAFALKLALGEMSAVVLASTKVSADKIEKAGFKFKFERVDVALKDIYRL